MSMRQSRWDDADFRMLEAQWMYYQYGLAEGIEVMNDIILDFIPEEPIVDGQAQAPPHSSEATEDSHNYAAYVTGAYLDRTSR